MSAIGWYQDPLARHQFRYWNGSTWTEHVADQGITAIDPIASSAPTHPTTGVAPAWSPPRSAVTVPMVAAQPTAVVAARRRISPILIGAVLVAAGGLIGAAVVILTHDDKSSNAVEYSGIAMSTSNATIEGPQGAVIEIPAGAVPSDRNEQPAQIVVTIEKLSEIPQPSAGTDSTEVVATIDPSANLPDGVVVSSEIYRLGPAAQTFQTPVTLTLPIPDGMASDQVGGLAYFDEAASSWVMVPSAVQNGVIQGQITHFSYWSIWSFGSPPSQAQTSWDEWRLSNGGIIEVTTPLSGTSGFPYEFLGTRAPRYTSMSVSYGICVESFTLDDPNNNWYVNRGERYGVQGSPDMPASGGTREFFLPSGTYQLSEYWTGSEINPGDPLYVPVFGWASRPAGTIRIDAGSRHSYNESAVQLDAANGWSPTRPACAGVVNPSLGTGDVQVTLTWPQTGVDLDLHVFDPNGVEISWQNTAPSTGGELDSDNQNGADVPENIFWATDAPKGTYTVKVVYYLGSQSANWTVRTVVDGRVQSFSGSISANDRAPIQVTTFRVD